MQLTQKFRVPSAVLHLNEPQRSAKPALSDPRQFRLKLDLLRPLHATRSDHEREAMIMEIPPDLERRLGFCPYGKPDEDEYSHAENNDCNRGHFDVGKPFRHAPISSAVERRLLIWIMPP